MQEWKTFHGWRRTLLNAHTHLVLGTLSFVNPLKVVVRSSDFSTIGNIQNFPKVFQKWRQNFLVTEVWNIHFHKWREIWIDKKSFNWPPFSKKKKTTKNKVVIIIMKHEDEEGEKAEKVGKNWVNGEVLHLNALWREMEFEFTKKWKNKVNSNLLRPWIFSKIWFLLCFHNWNLDVMIIFLKAKVNKKLKFKLG